MILHFFMYISLSIRKISNKLKNKIKNKREKYLK